MKEAEAIRREPLKSKAFFHRLFSNWIAKVLSIAAAVVLFLFQRLGSMEERYFSVPLQYYVDSGFVVTDTTVGSVRINLRGSGEEIFLVLEDDIEAFADISMHRSEGMFKSPVLLRKKGSAETVDVEMSVEPLEATAVIEQKVSKELEVLADFSGYPAVGYELVQHLTTPENVEITGPRSRVEAMQKLDTEVIDLSDMTADFTIDIPLVIEDDMITVSGSPVVEVHGIVRESIVRRTFEAVVVEYTGLPGNLVIRAADEYGSLRLSGPQLVVESVRNDDLLFEVDCSDLGEAGSYELKPLARVPRRLSVISYAPSVVSILVEELPSGESDPALDGNSEEAR